MNLNKKGSSTLTSFILYIFISIAVLAIVTTSATAIIRNLRQENNYNQMLSSITELEENLVFVSQNKHNYIDLTIKNPEELIIDCNNNKIIGIIQYDKQYSIDPVMVNNILTYKKENNIYFEKSLPTNINLDCSSIYLTAGQNKLKANYFSYDPLTEKINVDVIRNNNLENYWYNSKWSFRQKITIDHTNIDEDLSNFPLLVSIQDSNDLINTREDGKDILFTSKDGRTKLKREIEEINTKFKQKIIIDHTKVEEDLENFPVLIRLENDYEFKEFAREDGLDFYFTLEDNTLLKREIESYSDVINYKKKITIDHTKVEEDLENFPVLISLEDEDLKNYAKEDGADIYFTLEDGIRLKREIENFQEVVNYRKKIIIDHKKVEEDLKNFPVLIDLEDEDLKNYAKTDGTDIYFTLEDGTRLKREIEDYNSELGKLISWVKIPLLSSIEDTEIYINFGDFRENNSNDIEVWNDEYVFVHHFNENTLDSTKNRLNGTIEGYPLFSEGKIGKALTFNGEPDSVTLDFKQGLSDNPFTVSLWLRYTGYQSYAITQSHIMSPFASDWFFPYGSAGIFWMRGVKLGDPNIINDGTWHNVTMVWDTAVKRYTGFVDGKIIGESSEINDYQGIETIKVGARGDLKTTFFVGDIDNIRASKINLSSGWIKTEYNNQVDPNTFYIVEDLEEFESKELIAWVKIPELSSTEDTEIYINFGNIYEENENDLDYSDMLLGFNGYENSYLGEGIIKDLKTDKLWTFNQSIVNYNTDRSFYFPDNTTSGKYILTEDYSILESDTNSLTYYYWAKLDEPNTLTYPTLFFDRSQGAEPFTWIFENANSLTLQASNGVQAINYSASNFFTNYTNKYINIAITIKHDPENSEVKFYRNGELFRTINTTQILFPDQNTTKRIGSYSTSGTNSWVGNIKEFKLYNKILDENIIKTKYNNESSPEEFYSVGDLEIDFEKKELIAWVKIPYLSSTEDTEIYLNFGDKILRNNDTDTWDENYVFVNHLNTDLLESTYRQNYFTNFGAKKVVGKINSAFEFNGTEQNFMETEESTDYELETSDFTISGWFFIPATTTQVLWGGILIGSAYGSGIDLTCGRALSGVGAPLYINFSSSVPKNTWYYLTLKHENSEKKGTIYFNGEYKIEDTYPETLPTTNKKINLAKDQIYMTGKIDEARISNIARSPSWIKTEYNNQVDPNSFYRVEDLQQIKDLYVWVNIPKISSTKDTEIYMYYGNSNGEEENDSGVWDDGFIMVQHLNESPNNDENGFLDSTKNNFTGIAKGFDNINSTTSAKGKIGGANKHEIILDESNPSLESSNYAEFGTIYNNDWNYQTISVWVNFTGETNAGYALVYGNARYSNFGRFMLGSAGGILVQNQITSNTFSSNRVSTNEFAHIVYRYNIDENKEYIFVNGQKEEKDRETNISINNADPLRLGYADAFAFSGIIDEFKVSDVARSDSWITAEYRNQVDPTSFYTISQPQGH